MNLIRYTVNSPGLIRRAVCTLFQQFPANKRSTIVKSTSCLQWDDMDMRSALSGTIQRAFTEVLTAQQRGSSEMHEEVIIT